MSETQGIGQQIMTLAALEAVVGKTPPAIALKVIDHLDTGALHWISQSPLVFAGIGSEDMLDITLGGGPVGFASANERTLRLPRDLLDDPSLIRIGAAFGSLFLAPGIGETLRVNGRVAGIENGDALVAVDECYVHCAKALIRSEFWAATPPETHPEEIAGFIDASRFMALATLGAEGGADLSPKGDPAGAMAGMNAGELWFADRPGNRRIDSFRNIIGQPRIAAALLIPGSNRVAFVRGAATLVTDQEARAHFTVMGKVPKLVTRVSEASVELRPSAALERARLWPLAAQASGINPADMFVAHVKRNKDKGLGARLAGVVVAIPGLMKKGLEQDYKSNLY